MLLYSPIIAWCRCITISRMSIQQSKNVVTDLHNCTTIIGAAFGPSVIAEWFRTALILPLLSVRHKELLDVLRQSDLGQKMVVFRSVGEFFEDKKFLGGFSFGKRRLGVDRTDRARTGWVCGPLRDLFRLPNLKCISPPWNAFPHPVHLGHYYRPIFPHRKPIEKRLDYSPKSIT